MEFENQLIKDVQFWTTEYVKVFRENKQLKREIERLQKEKRETYKDAYEQGRFDERMKWLYEERTEETPVEIRYREALEKIANFTDHSMRSEILRIARQALKDGDAA